MSGLFTTLTSVANALDAQRYGLEVTGQNIANLNTEGYTRRRLDLAERSLSNGLGGVEVLGVRSTRDAFIEARVRNEVPAQARDSARSSVLSVVETSFSGGASVADALSGLFGSFSALSVDPQSTVAREGLVLQAGRVATAFNELAQQFDSTRRQADSDLRGNIDEINALTTKIADLNQRIGDATGSADSPLRDQLDNALESLSKLTRISVITQPQGTVDVSAGAGRALVVGTSAFALTVTSAPVTGLAQVRAGGQDITGELQDGTIGGLLRIRDVDLPNYQGQLDQLAYDVAQKVNTVHAGGFDAAGAAGGNFFKPLATVAGAAAQFGVDPAITADSSKIAASGTSGTGDNVNASALAGLRSAKAALGGTATFVEAWAALVNTVGSESAAAKTNVQTRDDVLTSLQQLRDSVSGVSLDEEAGRMMQFQRAYEANARFFTAVDSTLSTLLNTLGAMR